MIESPIYQEIVEESERKGETRVMQRIILKALVNRFGEAAQELEVELKAVDYDRLQNLIVRALSCPSLASFRGELLS